MTETPPKPSSSAAQDTGLARESVTNIQIRPVETADTENLVALWEACGLTRPWNGPRKDIEFARGGAASDILVGKVAGALAAAVMVGHDGHRGAVYYMAVDPARQGQGLGAQMMSAAEDWLKARGVWKINLMVRRENTGVLSFYGGLGFEPSDVVVMGKWIE